MHLTKRSFTTGVLYGAAAFLVSSKVDRSWSATTGKTRYNATSPEGKQMLATYAQGVEKMNSMTEMSSRSWTFQWYTHWVRGDSDKLSEISRVFGDDSSPARDLANLTWSSCQAHGAGMFEPHFLPWHRACLICFEDIVRAVTGNEDFTLPYWDYTNDPVLPIEFRTPNSPAWSALFVKDRNEGVNDGVPIDKGIEGDLTPTVLNSEEYLPKSRAKPGFNSALDGGIHGTVHVQVGTTTNMGQVPFAAKDPIFWVHHCNIDRIWASWNRLGGKNPKTSDWQGNVAHVFADRDGSRFERSNDQVSDLAQVGYTYDTYLQAPPVSASVVIAETDTPLGTLAQAGSIKLGREPTAISLTPVSASASTLIEGAEPPRAGKFYLILDKLQTKLQPGVLYKVFVGASNDPVNTYSDRTYLGVINFFDAKPDTDSGKSFVFPIGSVATSASTGGIDLDFLKYYVVPVGEPASEAEPIVGSVSLVEE